jgi:hypothetical protein
VPVVPAAAVGESKGREAMPSSSVIAAPQPNTRHGTPPARNPAYSDAQG